MKRKALYIYSFLIIVVLLGGYIAVTNSKTSNSKKQVEILGNKQFNDSADRLEIYYFHRTQRCSTCLAIGRYTKELIQLKYADKVEKGKLDFREINIDLPENAEIVNKYQAGGQSLYINAISDGQDNINQDINIWRLVRSESQFKNYLENKINSLLAI